MLLIIHLISDPGYGTIDAVGFLVREVALGAGVGVVGGLLAAAATKRADRLPEGLALVGSLASAALAYGAAGAVGGSGFLAVYMVGLAVGDAKLARRESLVTFHQALASFAEIGMFFALGLLVFPRQLGPVALKAVLLALITMAVARPVATALATWRQGFDTQERSLIAWAGLRGAVPVILATFAVIDGVPRGLELLNIVFFAVLVSATVQGLVVRRLADRLARDSDSGSAPTRAIRAAESPS